MKKKVYIDVRALENDSQALIKYVASDRSDGKSTTLIRLAFQEWQRSGKIGVIVRRTVNEISMLYVSALFSNLSKVVKLDGSLTAKGSPSKSGIHLYYDQKEFAVMIPLSRAGKLKSAFDVATHRNVYFDEYVPLDGRYLSNEAELLLELWRTIDRDTFTSCTWIFSNHVTAMNPIFAYYGIQPRDGISRWKNGRLILLQVANKGNRDAIAQSPLGELTEGTRYNDYAQGGTLDASKSFIFGSHGHSRLPFVIRCNGKHFGLYGSNNGLVLDETIPEPYEPCFITDPTGGTEGGVYLKSQAAKNVYQSLRNHYHLSGIYAASEKVLSDAKPFFDILN